MFTAEAGAVLGRNLWSEGPSQLSGEAPQDAGSRLFSLTARRKLRESATSFRPNGMGWWGRKAGSSGVGGQSQGPQIAVISSLWCLCPERVPHRSELQLAGVGHLSIPLPRHLPDLWSLTRVPDTPNSSPRFHIISHQESQLMASASGLASAEWASLNLSPGVQ